MVAIIIALTPGSIKHVELRTRIGIGCSTEREQEREREKEREGEEGNKNCAFFTHTESVLHYQWSVHHHLCLWYVTPAYPMSTYGHHHLITADNRATWLALTFCG